MSENADGFADGFIDGLLNEIADRVIKRISENNSNWLNTIQYKVKAENIEGQIKVKQIDNFDGEVERLVDGYADDLERKLNDLAQEAAEQVLKDATFTVDVTP